MSRIDIIEVTSGRGMKDFISFPSRLYSGDSRYSPQLYVDQKEHFSSKNPFLRQARVSFFIALKQGRQVGRVAAITNMRHVDCHHEKAGFFGFFECVNDPEAAAALLNAAGSVLSAEGMELMRGPMNFSTNEQCGFLAEGFNEPPMIMTPYNPPYYHDLMNHCGMEKARDLFGFIFDVDQKLPEKIHRVSVSAESRGIRVREIDMKRFSAEMLAFREVYHDAWRDNWGFIPLSDEELYYLGSRLKKALRPKLALFAEDRGRPIGFLGLLPDFNVVLRRMQGRISPLSLLKALYFSRKIKDLRLLLFGIKKEYRNKGVEALLLREAFRNVVNGRYRRIEFSWILEDNLPVQRLVSMAGGRMYKRYRIYEGKLP